MNQTHRLPAHEAGGLIASPLITGSAPPRPVSLHTVQFTGSGSEYFRIWIVNLLMMLLTFGLYYPWAKVRKLRYFYGNTLVIGHPLDFHGNPRQMLRGFVLVSALMLLYGAAGRVSPTSGMIAGFIVAAVWPALMRASLQFRLAQTSWRGLRFHFSGSLKDAYMVFLAPMLLAVGVTMLGGILLAMLPKSLGSAVLPIALTLGMLLTATLVGPYTLWRLKRYQHAHYALGQLQTTFKASYRHMLGIFVKTGLLGIGAMMGLGVLGGLLGATLGTHHAPPGPDTRQIGKQMGAYMAMIMPILLGYILLTQIVVAPYFNARMQNLVWTQTGNRLVRFKSHLGWAYMARLALKNWLLILLTLGLYWPFAAVALAKARLQAIVIHTRQDPDALIAQARQGSSDATGDLAADLIGMDVGL